MKIPFSSWFTFRSRREEIAPYPKLSRITRKAENDVCDTIPGQCYPLYNPLRPGELVGYVTYGEPTDPTVSVPHNLPFLTQYKAERPRIPTAAPVGENWRPVDEGNAPNCTLTGDYIAANEDDNEDDGNVNVTSCDTTFPIPIRREHKIRGLDAWMGRFISSTELPLSHPPYCPSARPTDLYIHHYGDHNIQIWLWDGDKWEGDIRDGHPHPSLWNHRLYVTDGREPTWVTRKTRTSYKGRLIKQARTKVAQNV
ncbi:hypothetical protein J3A83DRAFT_4380062 [Scleroderma citrinum]